MVRCDECREPVNEAELEDALAEVSFWPLAVKDLHRTRLTVLCGGCSRSGNVEVE